MPPNQRGDPYGARTRVSAVETGNRLRSTVYTRFPGSFQPPAFNSLRKRGDGSNAPTDLKSKAPDLAGTGSSAKRAYRGGGRDADNTIARPRIVGTLSLRSGGEASR